MWFQLLPLLLTYAILVTLTREVWVRLRPPGRHRPKTVEFGMSGWQSHEGLPREASHVIAPVT